MDICQTCKDVNVKQTLPINLICRVCKRGYCGHCWYDSHEYYATDDFLMEDGIYYINSGCDHCLQDE